MFNRKLRKKIFEVENDLLNLEQKFNKVITDFELQKRYLVNFECDLIEYEKHIEGLEKFHRLVFKTDTNTYEKI